MIPIIGRYIFKLYPSPQKRKYLVQLFDAVRFFDNSFFPITNKDFYKDDEIQKLNQSEILDTLKILKKSFPLLGEVSSQKFQLADHDKDRDIFFSNQKASLHIFPKNQTDLIKPLKVNNIRKISFRHFLLRTAVASMNQEASKFENQVPTLFKKGELFTVLSHTKKCFIKISLTAIFYFLLACTGFSSISFSPLFTYGSIKTIPNESVKNPSSISTVHCGNLLLLNRNDRSQNHTDRPPEPQSLQQWLQLQTELPELQIRGILPKENYIPVRSEPLPNPNLIWWNFEYFIQERHLSVPLGEREKQISDPIHRAFSFTMNSEEHPFPNLDGDHAPQVTRGQKIFWVDRYGGHGLHNNGGSGRAASRGAVQVKNIFRTPLAAISSGFSYSYGGGSLVDTLKESIWASIIYDELPWGAQPVLGIIDTSQFTHWPDGTFERRALLIRTDPLRWAHYMYADQFQPDPSFYETYKTPTESERTKLLLSMFPKIHEILGMSDRIPPSTMNIALEIIHRQTVQAGAAFARKFFHGSLTPSNFEITGQFMDFASMTSVPGYRRMIPNNPKRPPFGQEYMRIQQGYRDFFQSHVLAGIEPHLVKESLIEPEEMDLFIKEVYEKSVLIYLLKNTGFPDLFISEYYLPDIPNSNILLFDPIHSPSEKFLNLSHYYLSTQKALTLSPQLDLLGKAIRDLVLFEENNFPPQEVQTFFQQDAVYLDFGSIFGVLAELQDPQSNVEAMNKKLNQLIPKKDLCENLILAYMNAFQLIRKHWKERTQLPLSNLILSIKERARVRNRVLYQLYRVPFEKTIIDKVDHYLRDGQGSQLWNFVQSTIFNNRRFFDDQDPDRVVMKHFNEPLSNFQAILYFDAQKKNYFLRLKWRTPEDHVISFMDELISKDDFITAVARWTLDHWTTQYQESEVFSLSSTEFGIDFPLSAVSSKNTELVTASQREETLLPSEKLRIPGLSISQTNFESEPYLNLEFKLRSKDGLRWWGFKNQNILIKVSLSHLEYPLLIQTSSGDQTY